MIFFLQNEGKNTVNSLRLFLLKQKLLALLGKYWKILLVTIWVGSTIWVATFFFLRTQITTPDVTQFAFVVLQCRSKLCYLKFKWYFSLQILIFLLYIELFICSNEQWDSGLYFLPTSHYSGQLLKSYGNSINVINKYQYKY